MFDWHNEAVGELRRLFDLGHSASQIGAGLTGTFGGHLTRNAVIGALHRRGMRRGRPKPVPRPPRQRVHRAAGTWKPSAPTPEPEPTLIAPEPIPMPQRCTIMDLTNETCRWPIGEGAEMFYCGCPTADVAAGCPYCDLHRRIAYQTYTTTRRPFIPMRKAG